MVSVAFCGTYLLCVGLGAGGDAALTRSVGVAIATWALGRILARPAIDAVLSAMARDRAELERRRQEEAE